MQQPYIISHQRPSPGFVATELTCLGVFVASLPLSLLLPGCWQGVLPLATLGVCSLVAILRAHVEDSMQGATVCPGAGGGAR